LLFDVFICHASEDKDDVVRSLACMLRENHVEVWYDEFSIQVGDSIRRSIDKGLAQSRYGIIIVSPDFIKKRWTQHELDGLFAREMYQDTKLILPVWHNVSYQDILEFSPSLADKHAIMTEKGIKNVCDELIKIIKPHESPLIVAQDELNKYGVKTPVISDEWWLSIITASNRINGWGFSIPEDNIWGRWAFPLPSNHTTGRDRGMNLAWTTMQLNWTREADNSKITQITHPNVVHRFIESQPGLAEICFRYPLLLATYAPQLTIRGFEGDFKEVFDNIRDDHPELFALSNENLSTFDPARITCNYVSGELGGPHIKYFDVFGYLIWLLSESGDWLPNNIREFLIIGMKEWGAWKADSDQFDNWPFLKILFDIRDKKRTELTKRAKDNLLDWIKYSINELEIGDNPKDILDKFLGVGFIEHHSKVERKSNTKSRKIRS